MASTTVTAVNAATTRTRVFVRRVVSIAGSGDYPAYLGALQVPATIGPAAEFVETSGSVRFRVYLTDLAGPIVNVHAQKM